MEHNNQSLIFKESGMAILSVLLTLTLAILLVAGFSETIRRQIRFSSALQNHEQIYWYSLSAEELARQVLMQSFQDEEKVVHLGQSWATNGREYPLEKGTITSAIKDLQGCFNLNSLAFADTTDKKNGIVKPGSFLIFKALLENLGLDFIDAEQIAEATRDWVYPAVRSVSGQGAGNNDYLALPVPYLPANTAMRDESEWRSVLGVSASMAQAFLPYFCVIPDTALKININTVSVEQPEILAAAFLNKLSVAEAESILLDRPRNGWPSVDEFLDQVPLPAFDKKSREKNLTVNSRYFELNSAIRVQENNDRLQSLIVRKSDDDLVIVRRRAGEI